MDSSAFYKRCSVCKRRGHVKEFSRPPRQNTGVSICKACANQPAALEPVMTSQSTSATRS